MTPDSWASHWPKTTLEKKADRLNALYDRFFMHPEWAIFKTSTEEGAKCGQLISGACQLRTHWWTPAWNQQKEAFRACLAEGPPAAANRIQKAI